MADYDIPQYVDKRIRYFNNQFLQEQDFIDEQKYHINHLRQHQRSLHTPGIAEGLEVVAPVGATEATVKPGVAIDKEGRQIMLTSDRTIPLTDATLRDKKVVLAIAYSEEPADPVGGGETRFFERPIVRAFIINDPAVSDTTMLLRLAAFSVDSNGRVSTAPDLSVQLRAGINLGEPILTKITFSRPNVQDATQFPALSSGAANRIDIQGSLSVTGRVNERDLAADGTKLDRLSSVLVTAGTTSVTGLTVDGADLSLQPRSRVGGNLNVGSPSVSNIRLAIQSSTPNPAPTPAPGAVGALFVWNGSANSYGIVSKVSSTPQNVNPPLLTTGTGATGAAIAGITNMDNVFGVYAQAREGTPALFVQGAATVTGNLVKPSGQFRIDHPLDPTNKYLNHSFVESPDMKNIYDGVAELDINGEAIVRLPEWFEALNKDIRYQLTCIGSYAPVYISEEVQNNCFRIAGGNFNMKVSWQLTGVRKDAWANDHRIPVEEPKPADERGSYLYPISSSRSTQADLQLTSRVRVLE